MPKTGGVPLRFYMHISYICIYKWHICIYPILVYGMRHSMTHLNTYNMWFALPWLHRMSKRAAVRPICSSVRVRKRQTRMVVQVSCIACCTVLQSHKHLNDPFRDPVVMFLSLQQSATNKDRHGWTRLIQSASIVHCVLASYTNKFARISINADTCSGKAQINLLCATFFFGKQESGMIMSRMNA